MKVFTCTDFEGHYPVGTAAVIIAPDKLSAEIMFDNAIKERGLDLSIYTLQEVDSDKEQAIILCDGNY